MITILGSHISTIRPIVPRRCTVYNDELPKSRWLSKTKTVKEHCGRVKYICLQELGGTIWGVTKGTHLTVMETFNLNPDRIIRSGWQLDNDQFIWR